MLNLFKFHSDPAQFEDFEKHIRNNPKLMTELDLPDSPEVLKFALEVLDTYTDKDYDIIASVLTHKFYRPKILQQVMALCRNLNNNNKTLFKLLFVTNKQSSENNAMYKIVDLGYHITHPDIITNYMHYIETHDGVPLAKSLFNISHEKDVNYYNLIETIKTLVHDPEAYAELLLSAVDKPIVIDVQLTENYNDKTSADIKLKPSEGMYYALQLYDRLPKAEQKIVESKLRKAFGDADAKFAKIVLNNKYILSFNDSHMVERVKPIIGRVFEKTRDALGILYDNVNSRDAIKQINSLSGKEHTDAMKKHGAQVSNIMTAILALSK